MLNKYRIYIGIAAIIIFGALGIWALRKTANPYVGFDRARVMQASVQILGKINHHNNNYDETSGVLSFYIVEESGDSMLVQFTGTKPGNFEQAESVVCIGRYQNGAFQATNLLVKCPSKYDGTENQESGG